jgi:hypothetical protein
VFLNSRAHTIKDAGGMLSSAKGSGNHVFAFKCDSQFNAVGCVKSRQALG